MKKKVRYGLDYPGMMCQYILPALFLAFYATRSFYSENPLAFWPLLVLSIGGLAAGVWAIISSLWLKPKFISKLVDRLHLKGNETILDMGCGGGLFLIEAAKKLPSGKACGIDIWRFSEQANNNITNTLSNAKIEGVEERVEVKTACMGKIPYDDNTFDCVVSCLSMYSIDNKKKPLALSEMIRVLKPGGKFIIVDIFSCKAHCGYLTEMNEVKLKRPEFNYRYFPRLFIIEGNSNR